MKPFAAAAIICCAAAPLSIADADEAARDPLEVLQDGEPIEFRTLRELEQRLEAAAKREPREARWRLGLALAASADQRWADARKQAEEAAELEPDVARHHYLVGLYAIKQLEREESMSIARKARRHLENAVELEPDHTDARTLLGCYYAIAPGFVGGSIERAREQADALERIEGGLFGAHVVRARIAAEKEQWNEMERQCDAAVEAARSSSRLYAVRLRQAETLLIKADLPGDALAILNDLPDTDNDVDTAERYRLRGTVLQSLGHPREAARDFEHALDFAPADAEAAFRLGQCYADLGSHERAMRWYRVSLQIAPDHDEAGEARRALKRLERLAQAG